MAELETVSYVVPVRPSAARAVVYSQRHVLTFQPIYEEGQIDPRTVFAQLQVGEYIRVRPKLSLMEAESAETEFVWRVVMKAGEVAYLQIVPIYAPSDIVPLLEDVFASSESLSGVEYSAILLFRPSGIEFQPTDGLAPEYQTADMATSIRFLPAPVDTIDRVYLEIFDISQQVGITAARPTQAANVPSTIMTGGGLGGVLGRAGTTTVAPVPISPAVRPPLFTPAPISAAAAKQPPSVIMTGEAPTEVEQLLASPEYQRLIQNLVQQRQFTPHAALLEARHRAFQDVNLRRRQQGIAPLEALPRTTPMPPPPQPPSVTAAAVAPITGVGERNEQERLYDTVIHDMYKSLPSTMNPMTAANYIAIELPESGRRIYLNVVELARNGDVDAQGMALYLLNRNNVRDVPFPITAEQLAEIRRLWAREMARTGGATTTGLPPFIPRARVLPAATTAAEKAKQQQKKPIRRKKRPSEQITTSPTAEESEAAAAALLGMSFAGVATPPLPAALPAVVSGPIVATAIPPAKRAKTKRLPRTTVNARDIFRRDVKSQFRPIYDARHRGEPTFNIGMYNKELNEWLNQEWSKLDPAAQAEYQRRAQLETQQLKQSVRTAAPLQQQAQIPSTPSAPVLPSAHTPTTTTAAAKRTAPVQTMGTIQGLPASSTRLIPAQPRQYLTPEQRANQLAARFSQGQPLGRAAAAVPVPPHFPTTTTAGPVVAPEQQSGRASPQQDVIFLDDTDEDIRVHR